MDPLVLSIYIHIGSADVFHVELVVLKSPLGGGFRDVWCQQLRKSVTNEPVSSFRDFFCQFSLINIFGVFHRPVFLGVISVFLVSINVRNLLRILAVVVLRLHVV